MALIIILMVIVLAFVVATFFSLDRIRTSSESPNVVVKHVPNTIVETEAPQPQFPPAAGIDRQYQNTHVSMRDRHPVLAYQMAHNKGIVPATLGDPIRIPDIAGPLGLYGDRTGVYDSLVIRPQAPPIVERAPGPYPGLPIGVPVPAGALKMTSGPSSDYGYLSAVGGTFPYQTRPLPSNDFFRPYGPTPSPFVGSVDAYAPFPGVDTAWEKSGILTSMHAHGHNEILNLFRRPIAPGQDLWEYQVQDKDGFVIKLNQTRYLEDGDEVQHVIGKHGLGPWKVHMFVQNRYVWV